MEQPRPPRTIRVKRIETKTIEEEEEGKTEENLHKEDDSTIEHYPT